MKRSAREDRPLEGREKGLERAETGALEVRKVKVGDTVIRRPLTIEGYVDGRIHIPLRGRVVYVHPKGRFHVVEFSLWGGEVKEAFPGTDWDEEQRDQ